MSKAVKPEDFNKELHDYLDRCNKSMKCDTMGVTAEEDKKSLDVSNDWQKEIKTIDFVIDYLENPAAEASDDELKEHIAVLEEMKKIRKTALALEGNKK